MLEDNLFQGHQNQYSWFQRQGRDSFCFSLFQIQL